MDALSAEEIDRSLFAWVKVTQSKIFTSEMDTIMKSRALPKRSNFTHLSPFVDAENIFCIDGNIKHSLLAYDEKHPMILPPVVPYHSGHRLVQCSYLSQRHPTDLSLLRQRFWFPRSRAAVKVHIYQCLICVKWWAATPQQIMGNLPALQVILSCPFSNIGVDSAGPIMLRMMKGQGHKATKAFIAIFVCMVTKVIHIKVVLDYTTEIRAPHTSTPEVGHQSFKGIRSFAQLWSQSVEVFDKVLTTVQQQPQTLQGCPHLDLGSVHQDLCSKGSPDGAIMEKNGFHLL